MHVLRSVRRLGGGLPWVGYALVTLIVLAVVVAVLQPSPARAAPSDAFVLVPAWDVTASTYAKQQIMHAQISCDGEQVRAQSAVSFDYDVYLMDDPNHERPLHVVGSGSMSMIGTYNPAIGRLEGEYHLQFAAVTTGGWFGPNREVNSWDGRFSGRLLGPNTQAQVTVETTWTQQYFTPSNGGWEPFGGESRNPVTETYTYRQVNGPTPVQPTTLGDFRGTGKIRISHDGGTTWAEATPDEEITVDDMISVENVAGTRARILFPDGSAFVVKKGCLVKCLSGGLQVQQGEVWLNFKKQGRRFEIVTPTSVCGVLGTEFQVIVTPGVKDEIALFSGQVEVTANAGGTVTLSPGQKVSCTQSGLGGVENTGAFVDIASNPYKAAILGMSQDGIVSGRQQAGVWVFAPLETVMRMQFAKMVCGAMDMGVSEDSWLDSAPPFPDLKPPDPLNDFYPHDYVAAASAAGIIKGDKGKFKPYDGIYRIGVILMVVRALDSLAPGSLDAVPGGFTSAVGGLSGEHADAMRKAEYNDLTDGLAGFGAGWNAWGTASRGEVAQILWNAMWR
jgi:hypothetical protein